MKTIVTLALLLSVTLAVAQPSIPSAVTSGQASSTTTTTVVTAPPNEVSGVIISYNPNTALLVVQVPNVTAPVTYTTNSTTDLVDYANKPITIGHLLPGLPVTVFFNPSAPALAAKVILRQYAKPLQ